MSKSLVWISGASSGIGEALAARVPWDGTRLFAVSRRVPAVGEHLEADLAAPGSWELVGRSFERELAGWSGERAVFVRRRGCDRADWLRRRGGDRLVHAQRDP